jgi:hypothetical protein
MIQMAFTADATANPKPLGLRDLRPPSKPQPPDPQSPRSLRAKRTQVSLRLKTDPESAVSSPSRHRRPLTLRSGARAAKRTHREELLRVQLSVAIDPFPVPILSSSSRHPAPAPRHAVSPRRSEAEAGALAKAAPNEPTICPLPSALCRAVQQMDSRTLSRRPASRRQPIGLYTIYGA